MSPPSSKILPPLATPISLLPSHVADKPISLILTEIKSGYDFTVTDRATSEIVYKIKGHTDARTATKEVLDPKGQHLFSLVKPNVRLPKEYHLIRPDGSPFVDVEYKWGSTSPASAY